jgi:hypothetical protein
MACAYLYHRENSVLASLKTRQHFRYPVQSRCIIDNSDPNSGPTHCTCILLVRDCEDANVEVMILPCDLMC